MTRPGSLVVAAAVGAVTVAGCDRAAERIPIEDPGAARAAPLTIVPDALMVRFQEVKGQGSSRESWEVEVLQIGGDVRVRGSVRTGGISVPILHAMTAEEYADFWTWLRAFPLERGRPAEDAAAPPAGWRKTLAVDVVLDAETRWKSRTSWTRPLTTSAAWVDQIESRFHTMALDLAHREVDRQQEQASDTTAPGIPGLPGDPDAMLLPDGD